MYVNIWHGYRNLLLVSSEVTIIVIVVLSSLAIGDRTIAFCMAFGLHRLCSAGLMVYIRVLVVPVSGDTLDRK